jgi:hypothetical protein
MRNIVVAFLLIVTALALTRTKSGSDAARRGPGNVRVQCSVSPHRPTQQGRQVVATGEMLCDRPGPQGLRLTVALQRSPDGGQWTTVASQTYTATGAEASSTPVTSRRRSVAAGCANTTWRTSVTWSAQDKGGTTPDTTRTSEARRNVCQTST